MAAFVVRRGRLFRDDLVKYWQVQLRPVSGTAGVAAGTRTSLSASRRCFAAAKPCIPACHDVADHDDDQIGWEIIRAMMMEFLSALRALVGDLEEPAEQVA
jgi:hypothetical protein